METEDTKTRIFSFGRNSKTRDSFDFLGFTIYNAKTRSGYYRVGYKTSEKKSKTKKQKIKQYIKNNRDCKPKGIIQHLNTILIGFYKKVENFIEKGGGMFSNRTNNSIFKLYHQHLIDLEKDIFMDERIFKDEKNAIKVELKY